jgi:Na+/H+ antiporter NhaD/arsenite permease-like protein
MSLLFFLFLFAQAGVIQASGLAQALAGKLVHSTGTNPAILSGTIIFSTGILSSILDNAVVVASFIPMVNSLQSLHISLKPLWWCLLFGACYGGNITVIGSTANIVALGILEKESKITVHFLEWLKIGLIVGVTSMIISYLIVILVPDF